MRFFLAAFFPLVALCSVAQSGDYDLEKIKTTTGREYHEILIIDSDAHGLLFRHTRGIAKLPFGSLPKNLRMLYETTAPLEVPAESTESEGATEPAQVGAATTPLVFTVRTHHYSRPASDWSRIGYGCEQPFWPPHWSRCNPAHWLVDPYSRGLATRDFLYTSGLLLNPPGGFTYRFPGIGPIITDRTVSRIPNTMIG